MKTFFVLFIIGLAVLMITSAVSSKEQETTTPIEDPQQSPYAVEEDTKKTEEEKQQEVEGNSEQEMKEENLKPATKRRNSADVKPTPKEIKITIPIPDLLTPEMDPTQIGKAISKIPKDAQKEYIRTLRKFAKQNEGTITGNFYEAALLAIKNPGAATEYWKEQLESMFDETANNVEGLLNADGPVSSVNELIKADPKGTAWQGAEGVFLNNLSDGFRGAARWSDLGHDLAETTIGTAQQFTKPINSIPIFGPMKENFDRALLQNIRNGKFLIGSGLDAGVNSFSIVGDDRIKKYNDGLEKFRSFAGIPQA